MNTPAFPTAIPHDDTKALSPAARRLANDIYRLGRDRVRKAYDMNEGKA